MTTPIIIYGDTEPLDLMESVNKILAAYGLRFADRSIDGDDHCVFVFEPATISADIALELLTCIDVAVLECQAGSQEAVQTVLRLCPEDPRVQASAAALAWIK